MIYLDFAAATPVDERVMAAMAPYWQEKFHNPSALYDAARDVRADLEAARAACGRRLGCRAGEIYFTAGATEANNAALIGVARQFPGSSIVTSNIEHAAVRMAAGAEADVKEVAVDSGGLLDPEAIAAAVDEGTVLVSVGFVNGEIGTVQPLRKIAAQVRAIRQQRQKTGNQRPLYLHTDASQALEYLALDVDSLGLDLATVNGAKLYAPKQAAILYRKRDVSMRPFVYGGGQERGIRSGTENVPFAMAMAAALDIAAHQRDQQTAAHKKLQKHLLDKLQDLPGVRVNGSLKHRIPGNLNVSFTGVAGDMLLHRLNAQGVQAATGAACAANQQTPSRVLEAIGLSAEEIAGSLRLSMGRTTSLSDIRQAGTIITETVAELRQRQ